MASTQTVGASTRLQWWAKIALWTLVLAFGYLYLSSVKAPRGRASAEQTAVAGDPVSSSSEQAAVVDEGSEPTETVSTEVPAAAPASNAAVSEPAPAADAATASPASQGSAAPVQAAESAVFADTLMKTDPSGQSAAAPAPVPAAQSTPRSASNGPAAAAAAPFASALQAAPAAAGAAPAPVAAVPPKTASVPQSVPVPTPAASPESVPAVATPAPAPIANAKPAPAKAETASERRARIMAEYEAMRRQAPPGYPRPASPSGNSRYYYPGYGYGPQYYQQQDGR